MIRALLLALALATTARAANIDANLQPAGTVETARVAGVGANVLRVGRSKARALVFTIWNTASTAQVQLEINCTGQPTGWAIVANSAQSYAVEAKALDIVYPACDYRVNVTACGGGTCSVNVHYFVLLDLT